MATIALSAVGMAVGGSVGGTVLGLSMATIGRAAGAIIGQRIDQQIMGGGSQAVEGPRIDRFRLTGATEGADIQQIYGRMRVAGQDDHPFSRFTCPSLTTVAQDYEAITGHAALTLFQTIDGAEAPSTSTLFPGRLVLRESA